MHRQANVLSIWYSGNQRGFAASFIYIKIEKLRKFQNPLIILSFILCTLYIHIRYTGAKPEKLRFEARSKSHIGKRDSDRGEGDSYTQSNRKVQLHNKNNKNWSTLRAKAEKEKTHSESKRNKSIPWKKRTWTTPFTWCVRVKCSLTAFPFFTLRSMRDCFYFPFLACEQIEIRRYKKSNN